VSPSQSRRLRAGLKPLLKIFQQNLLIAVAFSLCALCVYQWYGETIQRTQIGTLNQTVYEKSAAIQGYTNSIKTMDAKIAQMDAQIIKLTEAANTNKQLVIAQTREINKLQAAAEGLTNQIAEYKKAVDTLEARTPSVQFSLRISMKHHHCWICGRL
jgi:peptidoglycan hydrolase CwlO-like protein